MYSCRQRHLADAMDTRGSDPIPDAEEDPGDIDFQHAGLYLIAFQTILANVGIALSSAVVTMVSTDSSSAVRTCAVCASGAAVLLYKPFQLGGKVPGLLNVFNTLRPCALIYLLSLVLQQLTHSCMALGEMSSTPPWRDWLYHGLHAPLLAAGFLRAYEPTSNFDRATLLVVVTLLLLSLLPLPAVRGDGPLCAAPSVTAALVRAVRSVVFSILFIVHVFSSDPQDLERGLWLVAAMRASAACMWALGCTPWLLPLAILQTSLCVFRRLHISAGQDKVLQDLSRDEEAQYSSPAAEGYCADGALHAQGYQQTYQQVSTLSDGEEEANTVAVLQCRKSGLFQGLDLSLLEREAPTEEDSFEDAAAATHQPAASADTANNCHCIRAAQTTKASPWKLQ
jgi:hypothetical protein